LVAKIGYQNFTRDGRLRAPRFQGFRTDKPPELCSINQVKAQSLDEYYRKRDFSSTDEPIGGYGKGVGNSFVIQKHDARRLHFDLRLERDGVLVSWAVPKGVPEESGDRRLAIRTEDHPIEYGDFEGRIPEGQYGAGTVEIWDKGFYIPVRWENDKVEFALAGKRLKARYELVKLEKEDDEWLLFKKE
jgi:bifunctional non-homologous end joining protein LigD